MAGDMRMHIRQKFKYIETCFQNCFVRMGCVFAQTPVFFMAFDIFYDGVVGFVVSRIQ